VTVYDYDRIKNSLSSAHVLNCRKYRSHCSSQNQHKHRTCIVIWKVICRAQACKACRLALCFAWTYPRSQMSRRVDADLSLFGVPLLITPVSQTAVVYIAAWRFFYLNEWQFFTARRIKYAAAYDTLSVGLTDCRAPIGFCIEMDTHYQTIQSPPNSARRDSITFSHQVKDLVKERWQSSNDISIYLVNSIQDRNTSSFITTVGRCCLLVKVIYVAIKFNLW